jgi:hypothetical protein
MDTLEVFYPQKRCQSTNNTVTLSAYEVIRKSQLKTSTAAVINTKKLHRDVRINSLTQLHYTSRSLGMEGPGRRNSL